MLFHLRRNQAIVAVVVVVIAIAALALVGRAMSTATQDRPRLAQKTVQTYWQDIGTGHVKDAYALLSPGVQAARKYQYFSQDMFGFLTQTAGVQAQVTKPQVNGDQGVVVVTLYAQKQNRRIRAYQHLFWQGDHWVITDQNGGLSQQK